MKKGQEEKNKIKLKLTKKLCILIIILTAFASVLGTILWSSPEIKNIDIYLTVGNYTGINVNSSALWFGTIPQNAVAQRNIIINNGDAWPRRVWIKAQGEIAKWISVTDNGFLLKPNEGMQVGVVVSIPPDAAQKNYTSQLEIVLIRTIF